MAAAFVKFILVAVPGAREKELVKLEPGKMTVPTAVS